MSDAASNPVPTTESSWQRLAPIFTLVVLAPVIAEVLSGATRVSLIFLLVPEMMVWGCGALLIRETVRRWDGGWTSMLLLGLGLSVAEEFLIQQTSLAPIPFPGANITYGRVWGVNLVWFLYFLVYESVWVVLVPVQVTELIYSERRDRPWLKPRGIVISSVVFLIGSLIAGFLWIKQARPKAFHAPDYHPPLITLLCGVGMIVVCVVAAYAARNVGRPREAASEAGSDAGSPWLAFVVSIVFGFPWLLLMAVIFGPRRQLPVSIPLSAGILWALLAFALIRWMASRPGWGDKHRWALVFGATLVCMIGGFSGTGWWPRVDLVGKIVLNVLAVVGFILLARRLPRGAVRTNYR